MRGEGVADEFWYGLSVRLGSVAPSHDWNHETHLRVPVERFLNGRIWLRDHCRNYSVGVDCDESISTRLRRARAEQEFVKRALHQPQAALLANDTTILESMGSRLVRPLRAFQTRDLDKLLRLPHGANFSVPGAGKTTVCYSLFEAERLRGRVQQLLVVAPLSAFEAWETEAQRCFNTPPLVLRFDRSVPAKVEVLLVNYQRLKEPYFQQLIAWATRAPTHIVLDEAHRMKRGRDGEWGRACLQLAHVAERRDILTGTPAPQSARDFVALLDYLWPNQARAILPATALSTKPPTGTMSLVNESLKPLFVRTTKKELGLNDPILHVQPIQLDPIQGEIYDALRNRYSGMFNLSREDRTLFAQMGEVAMYLLEAATNPALLTGRMADQTNIAFRYPPLAIPPKSKLADLIMQYHHHEVPPKFRTLAVMIGENAAAGRKTLVWSNFVGNLLALERILSPHKPALVYGGIPSMAEPAPSGLRTREGELKRFRSDSACMVLLANPAAMAEGVSLHETCHDAIYVDRTFNAGQYLQSLDRIHRLGLPTDTETRITFLLTEGTIDEHVDERVAAKAAQLADMLNDPDLVTMALPDDEDYGEAIEDLGDLNAVLGHLRGDD